MLHKNETALSFTLLPKCKQFAIYGDKGINDKVNDDFGILQKTLCSNISKKEKTN